VDTIRLLDIREAALDVAEVYAAVGGAQTGGVALFVGTVRDHDDGRSVTALEYSAHPTALARLRDVVDEVIAQHPVQAVAAVHRTGDLTIGDIAVIVAVACSHRGDAFVACRQLIDELKSRVPIWKRQVFADGAEEWVGTP
jgi:molybdopterin synthase catalytic subunit